MAGRTRFVILGSGGVGGVIGGRLFQHGHDVLLIARGEHLVAIRERGLLLEDPDTAVTLPIPAVGSANEITFTDRDIVVLATKTQDAAHALDDLRAAAPPSLPVVCATNGVEAERLALRRFAVVYALNVLMPTAYLVPGVVQVISAPIAGGLDVGRYPSGLDDRTHEMARAFSASSFSSDPRADIMRWKYRKLVFNTGNAVEAACGITSDATKALMRLAAIEAEAVLKAAGIDVATREEQEPKRALMVYRPIRGQHRGGGSTWQSMAKNKPVETDYLNGEIVLLGRLHGVATPVNAKLQAVMQELVRTRAAPGSIDPAGLLASLSA